MAQHSPELDSLFAASRRFAELAEANERIIEWALVDHNVELVLVMRRRAVEIEGGSR